MNDRSSATLSQWVEGARPRTLPAAVAPVLAGTGVAAYVADVVWGKALLALGVSLALQIGVNYANDYSDGIRGTDDDRVGPLRLVGSGLARPSAVKAAALGFLGLGALLGGLAGFALLMHFVLGGRPQAGLPLLNGGAILGWALAAFLLTGSLGL